jgi:acetoacetyl-CoA synthetase
VAQGLGEREEGKEQNAQRPKPRRSQLSARHVPNEVLAIPEVPRTISGKKLEVPVKKILLGQPAEKACNRSAMANPESIDWFIDFAARRMLQDT